MFSSDYIQNGTIIAISRLNRFIFVAYYQQATRLVWLKQPLEQSHSIAAQH